MRLKVIASGSTGNAYVLSQDGRSLLLDAGVPWKEIMRGVDFDLSSLDGALVTHEHNDHFRGTNDLLKYGVPVVMSSGTFRLVKQQYYHMVRFAVGDLSFGYNNIILKEWVIKPFEVEHDAIEPLGFLILNTKSTEKIVYLTDTGFTKYVPNRPDHLIIECSYCEDILDANKVVLQDRYLRLKQHHFGLARVKTFLTALDRSNLKSIVLVHLSATNSNEKQMLEEIAELTGIMPIIANPGIDIDLSMGGIIT